MREMESREKKSFELSVREFYETTGGRGVISSTYWASNHILKKSDYINRESLHTIMG